MAVQHDFQVQGSSLSFICMFAHWVWVLHTLQQTYIQFSQAVNGRTLLCGGYFQLAILNVHM